jgi:hypothetical protein
MDLAFSSSFLFCNLSGLVLAYGASTTMNIRKNGNLLHLHGCNLYIHKSRYFPLDSKKNLT